MMALVEHDALQAARGFLLFLVCRSSKHMVHRHLMENERVIGDDELRLAPRPHRLLDETATVVRASGINAVAAPIGKADRQGRGGAAVIERRLAQKAHQPSRKVASAHVAVPTVARPPGDQRGDQRTARGLRHPSEALLHVEQAQIVFSALSNDHPLPPLVRVGKQSRRLLFQLPLQILGERGNPHAGAILPRPQMRGRQISQGLPQSGPRLRQENMVLELRLTRRESTRGCRAITLLLRPRLGVLAEQCVEHAERLLRLDPVL